MRWFPIALLFSACFVAAQNTPSPAAIPEPGQKIRVEGTLLSLNGDPVRKATVRLQGTTGQPGQPPNSYVESTDNAGKFVFEEVPPGRYTLSAEKSGFLPARYGARSITSPGTQLNLSAGMEMKDLAIRMTPQGVIAGKVFDQDGDPVVSVQVQVMRYAYAGGRKQLQPTVGGNSNDLGEYRISNLAPGRYYVTAVDRRSTQNFTQEKPGHASADQESNITTYYPSAIDVSAAVPIDVAAGAEMRGMDIRLLRARVYTVRGKAVDSSGVPASAFVTIRRKEDNSSLPAVLNGGGTSQLRPDGSFEFRNIVPGTYILQLQMISVNGNQPSNVTGRVEVSVGEANIDDLVLPLGPGAEISGTMKLEDGDIATLLKPAQNAAGPAVVGNTTFIASGRFSLTLIGIDGAVNSSNTQIKEDGTFRFNPVAAGKYTLNVSIPNGTYLKSTRFGGQDVTNAPIDLTSSAGGALELVLSTKVASVTGVVHNEKGEPVSGAMVTLWPKTPDASISRGVRPSLTDQSGTFKFQGLAPGDYYVAAWEDLDLQFVQSADFMSRFTNEASSIKLSEGGQESKDLALIPAEKIATEIAKLP